MSNTIIQLINYIHLKCIHFDIFILIVVYKIKYKYDKNNTIINNMNKYSKINLINLEFNNYNINAFIYN